MCRLPGPHCLWPQYELKPQQTSAGQLQATRRVLADHPTPLPAPHACPLCLQDHNYTLLVVQQPDAE